MTNKNRLAYQSNFIHGIPKRIDNPETPHSRDIRYTKKNSSSTQITYFKKKLIHSMLCVLEYTAVMNK